VVKLTKEYQARVGYDTWKGKFTAIQVSAPVEDSLVGGDVSDKEMM